MLRSIPAKSLCVAVIDPTRSPAWAQSLAVTQQRFAEDLEAAGFLRAESDGVWEGELEVASLAGGTTLATLQIEIGDAFPFRPPRVVDASMVSAHTWHHDPDWSLCLYGTRNVGDRPWQTVSSLLDRVRDWFDNAAAGWPDDPPDLDLERYFERVAKFVTYDDLDALIGKPVSAKQRSDSCLHIDRVGYLPPQKRSKRQLWWGWVGDLGELDAPVFDWPTVQARLGERAGEVTKRVQAGGYEFLALRYRRRDHVGVIVLFPQVVNKTIRLQAATAAGNDSATRRLRAGPPETVEALSKRTVAIVGVGAVGSYLADMLARAGIGRLHLVDHDLLRPGNCIRHLAGYESTGEPKTVAVRKVLVERELMAPEAIETTEAKLDPVLAVDVLDNTDVVIDATADDNVRALLVHLHESATNHGLASAVVSVAVHRTGGVIRSDRWPRAPEGAPDPIPVHPDGEHVLFEGGCGDPVSTTPAASVVEAAGLASRHIVDLLAESNALPDSIVQILTPQPDAPYQSLGVVGT